MTGGTTDIVRASTVGGRLALVVVFLALLVTLPWSTSLELLAETGVACLLTRLVFPLQSWAIGDVNPYNPAGYAVVQTPPSLHAALSHWVRTGHAGAGRQNISFAGTSESHEDDIIFGPTTLLELSDELSVRVREMMRPLAEQFCECSLERGAQVFGVRVYHSGASLAMHLDQPHAWVVSASLSLTDQRWPLVLEGRGIAGGQMITLEDSQALMYEGARVYHGRPQPLRGGDYAGVFVGFVPASWPDEMGWATWAIVSLSNALQPSHTLSTFYGGDS
jgi:hypothetical protein